MLAYSARGRIIRQFLTDADAAREIGTMLPRVDGGPPAAAAMTFPHERSILGKGTMKRKSQSVNGNIRKMVRRIVAQFRPEQVYLFGSRARGSAKKDSDADLLVVMPVNGSKREKRIQIGVALHDIPMAVDVVVVTPQEMEKWKDIPAMIPRVALKEGKLLYARACLNPSARGLIA
ncbi:MAG: nucleotidyltransferase domain-containing protein [Nitrospirae bacterium]|nr:nucleotidyltransferase domain-containing protein [Nitrospirota bacterium]